VRSGTSATPRRKNYRSARARNTSPQDNRRGNAVVDAGDDHRESDADYFTRRAGEELAAAMDAVHPEARRAHLDLANRHMDLADAIKNQEAPAR
jgi:hypothetical protein